MSPLDALPIVIASRSSGTSRVAPGVCTASRGDRVSVRFIGSAVPASVASRSGSDSMTVTSGSGLLPGSPVSTRRVHEPTFRVSPGARADRRTRLPLT